MSSFIIIMLLAYNIWILSVLMRPGKADKLAETVPKTDSNGKYEVVGASKFNMADWRALKNDAETISKQVKEEPAEEDVSETDVAFEQTEEELDKMFTYHRIEDVTDDEWDEEHRNTEVATGHSFNELGKAFDTAKKSRPTKKERLSAGEVLSDIRGTELEEQVKVTDSKLSERISKLIDLYIENLPEVKLKPSAAVSGSKEVIIPASVEEFNIADFV